ncbi:hypothetical protein Ancab_018749 [Ancistrocladus abbreviatus]
MEGEPIGKQASKDSPFVFSFLVVINSLFFSVPNPIKLVLGRCVPVWHGMVGIWLSYRGRSMVIEPTAWARQDVRGNIKLSLKATLPRPAMVADKSVPESAAPVEAASPVWASIVKGSVSLEDQSMTKFPDGKPSTSTTPSFLIRSAAECDDEAKSAGSHEISGHVQVIPMSNM